MAGVEEYQIKALEREWKNNLYEYHLRSMIEI